MSFFYPPRGYNMTGATLLYIIKTYQLQSLKKVTEVFKTFLVFSVVSLFCLVQYHLLCLACNYSLSNFLPILFSFLVSLLSIFFISFLTFLPPSLT